jgi:hypothetical protein
MSLKEGAQEEINKIRAELAVLESLSPAEQDEEKIHSFRTIVSCADALQEIDRDMETFQVVDILVSASVFIIFVVFSMTFFLFFF